VKRVSILIVTILIGAAAPARAWCEATCPAPSSDAATSHCPTNAPAEDGAAITASEIDDCPAIESARPATAKIEFVHATSVAIWHLAPRHLATQAPRHQGTQAPRHPGTIPLRI
jgi:hypothetical protein